MPTGTRPTAGRGKPSRRADRGRCCPVCGERLSTYNRGPNCYTHTDRAPWRGPTTPPARSREAAAAPVSALARGRRRHT